MVNEVSGGDGKGSWNNPSGGEVSPFFEKQVLKVMSKFCT